MGGRSSDYDDGNEWRGAFGALVAAQAEMLRWYREAHGPTLSSGDICALESAHDERDGAISAARIDLLKVPAPGWPELLIKLENLAWLSGAGTIELEQEPMQLLCADLIRLAAKGGHALEAASNNPHVGPDYTGSLSAGG